VSVARAEFVNGDTFDNGQQLADLIEVGKDVCRLLCVLIGALLGHATFSRVRVTL
jgi:hypothetical protein